MNHPLMRALLVRVAYDADCTPPEADRIIRRHFSKLNPENTLQTLRETREAHPNRYSSQAEQIIQQLIHEQTKTDEVKA